MRTSEAVAAFLSQAVCSDLVSHYHCDLELQVNVSAGSGEPVPGRRNTYTNGKDVWHSVRIPKGADTEPVRNDYELKFPLGEHVEAIGSTGWNFSERRSEYVGFDFDALTGHAAGVGISDEQLEAVRVAASAVPWVEVRKSTGGAGLHFYVRFEKDVATANHTEHAALARAVLSMLSAEANFDFASQIDCCGGILWFWHRKTTVENQGLTLLKAATKKLALGDLPANWLAHKDVVNRKRKKVAVDVENEADFDAMVSSRKFIPLDAVHKLHIARLVSLGHPTVWVNDHHCLQTHTFGLRDLMGQPDLSVRGFFETVSSGNTPINCFLFPLPDGAWKVCRFGKGVREADTWNRESACTWCFFNRVPDLASAATAMGGVELKDNKGWQFETAKDAMRAAKALGEEMELHEDFHDRKAILGANKDGRLTIDVKHKAGDNAPAKGWSENRAWWTKVCWSMTTGPKDDADDSDSYIRVMVSPAGENAGVFVASSSGTWDLHPLSLVRPYLKSRGHADVQADRVLGEAVRRRWQKVSLPFQGEYPGDRRWNLGAPQLRYQPLSSRDNLYHPTWDSLLNHAGQTLTPFVRGLEWAREANVLSGGDYLRCWYASILREPFQPLPYLFMFGPENTGKTAVWDCFDVLVTSGIVKADKVLTGQNEFNYELFGAILCAVEERNITKTPGALARIKDYVTSSTIAIRGMRQNTFQTPNMTHWIQCSQEFDACPILDGDTRITAWYVPTLAPGTEIPKAVLKERLAEEAPAFLRTLLDLVLPAQRGRLRLPIVETDHKRQVAQGNRTPLEQFVAEVCHHVPGAMVAVAEFWERFTKWLPPDQVDKFPRLKTLRGLPPQWPRGAYTGNVAHIGNLCFDNCVPGKPWYLLPSGRLSQE